MSDCRCTKIFLWGLEWILMLPLTLCNNKSRGVKFAVFWLAIPWAMLTLPLIVPFLPFGVIGVVWDTLDD